MKDIHKKRFSIWEVIIVLITSCVLSSVMSITGFLSVSKPEIKPAYYCGPDTSYKRAAMILKCLNNLEVLPTECEEIARKTYGIAGFQKGSRIFPCFKAETPEEKEACGDEK